MRAARTATLTTLLYKTLHTPHPNKLHINKVNPFYLFFTISTCKVETKDAHVNKSSCNLSGIANSVISTCAHLLDKSKDDNFNEKFNCLKDFILSVGNISPETIRRFRRVSVLKPEDVLEILLGFESCCERDLVELRKVKSLWRMFRWANGQCEGFKHVRHSYEVMASMLVRVGLFEEVECLFSMMESEGIVLECNETLSDLIRGYVELGDLERSVSMYDRIRGQGLVPLVSCYVELLEFLVQKKECELVFRVCMDVVEMRTQLNNAEKGTFDNVLRLLCRVGKIQEARNLVKNGMAFGLEPGSAVINEIASGYCEKKDFEDALGFFFEIKRPPDILTCNKIIFSICSNFGTERADLFFQDLEDLGIIPDEITFGILIGWSCREGKLKNAFLYLSETFSRGLKPDVCSYNALISSLFKEGMWENAREVLLDMTDRGITANILTFKVLLAGYCKARQLDEAKLTVREMVNQDLIKMSSSEDPLSKAFMVLGLNPTAIRVRRDNHVAYAMTEFFDNLGNGLYLETDIDQYEKTLLEALEDSMITDFNSHVMKECDSGNFKSALLLVDHMIRWGQELSVSTLSALLKGLCSSRYRIKDISSLLEKFPKKIANQLDQEALNLVVQAYSKKGFTYQGLVILDEMLRRHLTIKTETCTVLLTSLFEKGNLKDLRSCWNLAWENKWLPDLKDYKSLVGWLCQKEMLKELLALFESMVLNYPHLKLDIYKFFLEKLSATGYTCIAHVLVEKVQQQSSLLGQTAYNHLVRGYIKENRYSDALSLFERMFADNLAPSLDVSVLLIPHLLRANRVDRVASLKNACLTEYPSESECVDCTLINGLCKTRRVGEAAILFQDLLSTNVVPDTELVHTLILGYCQSGDMEKVLELLGVMVKKNTSFSILSYQKLVKLMCMNRVLWALNLKELMLTKSNSSRLIISNILIFYLFLSGNSLYVDRILDEFSENKLLPDAATYNFLVYGYSQGRDVSRSLQYLTTMISEGLRPNSRSLTAVISSLCENGELEKAMIVSKEMESRGWTHSAVVQNALVKGLISHGKHQEAENFLNRMVENNLIPDNINYDNLIKQFCAHRRFEKAIDLLNLMLKKGNVPNSTSYDSLINGLCKCNKLDQAMDFHIEMLDMNLKASTNTWEVLVQNFCGVGQTAEAEKLLTAMVQLGETPTRKMYCSVVNRYRFERNLVKASEILQAMQQLGYDPDFETHWSLISNLSNSHQKDDEKANPSFLSGLLSGSSFA